MTRLIGAMTSFVLIAPLADAADPTVGNIFSEAAKYGIWALVAVALGYLMVRQNQSLQGEIKEVREQHLKATEGLLTRATVALEKHVEVIEKCQKAQGVKD
jgi:hypothetical protein